jgi:ribosome-associated translation inhibitor RaiA
MKLKDVPRDEKQKSRARALLRRGVRSQSTPPAAALTKHVPDESMCERCGNVYRDKRWVAGTSGERRWPVGFAWTVCPACRQSRAQEYFGRLVIRGPRALREMDALRRRIENIATRARFTQPQRRVISIERRGNAIEVLTTSQKLAHRITAELVQAFGGEAKFAWSADDGLLRATWDWSGDGAERVAVRVPQTLVARRREAAAALGKRTLEVEIQCRHVDLDPTWRDRIERRVARWAERLPDLMRVHVTLLHGGHHRLGTEEAMASVFLRGSTPYARKRAKTMTVAIREMLAALDEELRDVREERREQHRIPESQVLAKARRQRRTPVRKTRTP